MALGTPHYMSPEQALGEQNLDQRSDIYGLGATVYHAMLGRTLHDGKSSTAIMYQQVTEQLDLKPLVEAGITPPLVRLLGGMLEKERARRFSDWSAVLTVLREIDPSLAPAPAPGSVSDPALCGVGSASDRRRRQPVRALIATALLGAALTAGLAGGLYLLIGGAGHNHLTPETFAASVAAGHQGPVTLVPGDYGPVALGSAQSGLVISAAAPGVIFHGDRRAPALRLLAGATAIELHGIDFVADGGDAVHAEAGARARLVDCRVSGACERLLAAQGARLHCSGLTGRGRIEVDGGEVTFDGCSLAAPAPVIALRGATVLLGRTRVSGSGDGSVVTCSAADLVCDAVIIDGPSAACGLDLAGGTCTLRDLSITARGLGLRCAEATVSSIDGLTVNAGEVALAWSGPFPTGWRWFNLDLRAPQRHQGLSEVAESVVAGAGIGGARVQRLRQIPIDTP